MFPLTSGGAGRHVPPVAGLGPLLGQILLPVPPRLRQQAGVVTALLGGPVALQVILALVTALGLVAVIRPSVVRRLHSGPDLKTGAEALIGKRATVLRELAYGTPGRVKIGGEEWTAEPYDEDDRIEVGETVDVVQIKGATAYVLRVHRLEP